MVKICEYCSNEFDEQDARDEFEMETQKNYDYLTKCLCAECAIQAIDSMVDGVYYEVCENCGIQFDPFSDELELQNHTGDDGAELSMFGKYLCLDCALSEYMDYIVDEDDSQEERISVHDSAFIRAFNGKDEDY